MRDAARRSGPDRANLARIEHIVVIYAENRSFDNLYGLFPGANGIAQRHAGDLDADGPRRHDACRFCRRCGSPAPRPIRRIPRTSPIAPFRIDAAADRPAAVGGRRRDLVHRFYTNQEQINGGKLDRYAAMSDAGGLVMGYYDGSSLPLWKLAREYTLADNFFMGAFGGSFLNHFWLVCACTPSFPNAPAALGRGPRRRRQARASSRARRRARSTVRRNTSTTAR